MKYLVQLSFVVESNSLLGYINGKLVQILEFVLELNVEICVYAIRPT